METAVQKVTCPICDEVGERLWRKEGYFVSRCTHCKTLFVENPPPDTSFLYDESYFFSGERGGGYGSYDEEKEAMRGTFEKCLDHIAREAPQGTLFDIGAATGYFLALARARGYRVAGVDISEAASREAQKKGIQVWSGSLATMPPSQELYNIVTAFDVLEHVAHPREMLQQVHTILAKDGVVFGSTPDSGSFTARLLGKRWHLLCPPEHLALMNDASLRDALTSEGFEVLWTGRIIKRFSPPYILQTASRWLKLPFLGRLGRKLRGTTVARLAIPLDLRDNVFFMARKLPS